MDDQQGHVIDGTARARQWRRSKAKARPAPDATETRSDAPKSFAGSLLVPAEMLCAASPPDERSTEDEQSSRGPRPRVHAGAADRVSAEPGRSPEPVPRPRHRSRPEPLDLGAPMDDRRARTRPRSDPPRGASTLAETFGDAPSAAPGSPSARRGLGRRRRRHGSDPHTAARHASGVRVSASCSRDTRNTRAGSQRGDQPLRPTVGGTRSNGRDGATSPGAPPRRHASSAPTGAQAHGRHGAVHIAGVRLRQLGRCRAALQLHGFGVRGRRLPVHVLERRRRYEWRLNKRRLAEWCRELKRSSTGIRTERNPWTRSLTELMTPLRKRAR